MGRRDETKLQTDVVSLDERDHAILLTLLTKLGLSACAKVKGVRPSDLPWIPDDGYRYSQNLAHRLGVNAFFCALIEASRTHEGHCLATWRPEHWVRTKSADVKPDGFGRYLHPGGACQFYLEYDRGTEAFGASRPSSWAICASPPAGPVKVI